MTFPLVFKNVSKLYGTRVVLDAVSFEAETGRKIAIMGRSGSGKSTLLHLAAGIDVASSGTVLIDGKNTQTLSEKERTLLRRDHVGLVFQFFYLLPHLSVADNVALPDLIAGASKEQFTPRVMKLLAAVGLADRAHDTVQKLSGGEMQRIAICRALLRRPKVLLADEPTGNLDDESSQAVMKLLFDLSMEAGSTLIYVTHSRELADMANAVWHLQGGRLTPT